MKTDPQCLEEKRLTARAIALHDRLARLDAKHDAELTTAKEYETATVMLIIDLMRSGPSLTVHGRRYIDTRLAEKESWLDDVSLGDDDLALEQEKRVRHHLAESEEVPQSKQI
jgi:hypothetical protein